MWALVIEDVAKIIEAALLCTERRRRRFRRVLLQRAMHALVTTVLLRSACLNPFVNNPKLHPAEREFPATHTAEVAGLVRRDVGAGATREG
jgi:hypothetical protein